MRQGRLAVSPALAGLSAPLCRQGVSSVGTSRPVSASVRASLAVGVAAGRISQSTSDDWTRKIESGEWSEQFVGETLNLMNQGTAVAASAGRSAVDANTRELLDKTWKLLAETKALIGGAPAGGSGAVMASGGRPVRPASDDPRYALNPMVERVMASSPTTYRHGVSAAAAPTLFRSGDLPVYTASGIDPQALLGVPWMARHPIAAAKTLAEAQDLIEFVSGPDGEDNARADGMGYHPGNRDYEVRVNYWLAEAGTHAAGAAQQAEDTRVAASAGMVKAPHEMTDDERYDAMFGHLDRHAEARRRSNEDAVMAGTALGHGYSAEQILAMRQRRVAAGAAGPRQEMWDLYHPAKPE